MQRHNLFAMWQQLVASMPANTTETQRGSLLFNATHPRHYSGALESEILFQLRRHCQRLEIAHAETKNPTVNETVGFSFPTGDCQQPLSP